MIGGSKAVARTAKIGIKSYVMSNPSAYASRHLKLATSYKKEPLQHEGKANDLLSLVNILLIYTCA